MKSSGSFASLIRAGRSSSADELDSQPRISFYKSLRDGTRFDHLRFLVAERKARQRHLKTLMTQSFSEADVPVNKSRDEDEVIDPEELRLSPEQIQDVEKAAASLRLLKKQWTQYSMFHQAVPVEIRIDNFSYSAPIAAESNKIDTVYNTGLIYRIIKYCEGKNKENGSEESSKSKPILDNISLALKPGRMYLVLGPPSSGKSSLLKAIAGRLSLHHGEEVFGSVSYNGKRLEDERDFHIENAIAFVGQLDRHAPRLTVDETFEFAFQCKRGGSHVDISMEENKEAREQGFNADVERLLVNTTESSLGLDHVKDTFVGDDTIRGVSGGQRRRVTVGEMTLGGPPVVCGDEISNGLDSSVTFDMIQTFMQLGKAQKRTHVISLLQPSPETVSLFDEVVLLAEGKLIYAGPIGSVEEYFASLGYKAPDYLDIADFLQLLATSDAGKVFEPTDTQSTPYCAGELASIFQDSVLGKRIRSEVASPLKYQWSSDHPEEEREEGVQYLDDRRYQHRYANSFFKSTWLNLKRNILIWKRDKRVLIANAVKNAIMGISVGGVFYQTDDVISTLGVLFQGMLFIMLSGMTTAPGFVDERSIFYKQADANFFSAYPFVLGKALSKLPQTTMDCFTFGTILYFMVGLAPTPGYYFTFMGVIIAFSILMNELLFAFATISKTKANVQVVAACLVLFFILFCGFIIPPNVIPDYFVWIYWYNPLAWAYRALLVNEYRSSFYTTENGDQILEFIGLVDLNGNPMGREWILYGVIYMLCHIFMTALLSAIGLSKNRISGESGAFKDEIVLTEENGEGPESFRISFKPVALSFENICYDVITSKGKQELRLLHNVNGAFKAGHMCALMGTSGAGKTTLMDVIAMRKTSGTTHGEVRLNGYLQDENIFRRCSGYVEQFDVQTPQLTVRETVLFSARLRLDERKVKSEAEKVRFCDHVLKTLELTTICNRLVGSEEEGGLSFEQRKRLSIAVELAASPSILFLDEPTTGLDARSALLVVKLLRKIADQGRTICATIHQPSSAVFDLFDDLLLLKKGGRVVYFGELGEQSKTMISYFEDHGASRIDIGDNPANWMLREIEPRNNSKDLAEEYKTSSQFAALKAQLTEVKETLIPSLEISFPSRFASSAETRQRLMNKRLQTIYWRSPAYNRARLLVCIVIAFILGAVFVTNRTPDVFTESDIRARLSVTFLSFIIIGILSITSVLPVMLKIRDVFYRHRAAGMLENISLGWALGTAEKWFIIAASFLFSLVFLSVAGHSDSTQIRRGIGFWGFFTFNLAIYSYFGQSFMCLVNSMTTAQILASVFIGLNNFFSGLIVRPQFMTGLFNFTYWITPGHYVYEGLVITQFIGDRRPVAASSDSEFFYHLGCDTSLDTDTCFGTVEDYVEMFFGGRFTEKHLLQDIFVLAFFLVAARVMTFCSLKYFNFSDN